MATGLTMLVISVLMIFYAYISYRKIDHSLAATKQEDLVSYYLDLFYELLPVPVWSCLLGIVLLLISLIVIIVNIPVVF